MLLPETRGTSHNGEEQADLPRRRNNPKFVYTPVTSPRSRSSAQGESNAPETGQREEGQGMEKRELCSKPASVWRVTDTGWGQWQRHGVREECARPFWEQVGLQGT